jgi:FAD binding domain
MIRSASKKSCRSEPFRELRVTNPHAAGIDVHAKEHWVAVPPEDVPPARQGFAASLALASARPDDAIDAVHVMTPAAGAGIKYAMEDAVVAANLLAEPLKSGSLRLRDLAEVQRRRERPARLMQFLAGSLQQFVGARQPASIFPLRIPWAVRWMFRIPWVRDLPSRFAAFGLWRVHVQH